MTLIDGKAISEQVKQEIAAEVAEIVARGGKRPHLAAILVGHDGGSETYVAAKVKACEVCGFKSSLIRYEADVTEKELLAKVRELNEDADVDGFIVQLPLPKHISEQKVIETIDYRKDVDGFHPINVGRMSIGLPCYVSATPNGILELLKRYQIETSGKKCVVLGRSNIVGKPMAALMMQKAYPGDATVTVCHSRSKDLVKECQEADIIIAALGQPNFVKAEMVKEGAVVIDVGTTRVPDTSKKSGFKLTGDVVGTMIVAMQKGVARGIFSNESGLGSAPIAAAAAKTKEPVRQGLVSMTGTFIDTIIICTMTGLSIVLTGAWQQEGLEGVQVTTYAFQEGLPISEQVAAFLLMLCLVFFAFTTILGWDYYSERCLEYLSGKNKKAILVYRWLYILAVFIGPYMTVKAVWTIADIFNGLMAIPNMIAIFALSGVVVKETKDFFKRHAEQNQFK